MLGVIISVNENCPQRYERQCSHEADRFIGGNGSDDNTTTKTITTIANNDHCQQRPLQTTTIANNDHCKQRPLQTTTIANNDHLQQHLISQRMQFMAAGGAVNLTSSHTLPIMQGYIAYLSCPFTSSLQCNLTYKTCCIKNMYL